MNQHGLAGPDVCPVVQGQPREVEREVDGGGGRVGQVGLRGHLEGHRARTDGQLRVATERIAGHRHHPSSDPLLGPEPGPLHRAQYLHAGGVGQGRADGPVATAHAVDVVEVEGRGRDPDQQLVRARHGGRNLLEPQDLLRLAELVHPPCPHVARLLHSWRFGCAGTEHDHPRRGARRAEGASLPSTRSIVTGAPGLRRTWPQVVTLTSSLLGEGDMRDRTADRVGAGAGLLFVVLSLLGAFSYPSNRRRAVQRRPRWRGSTTTGSRCRSA